MTTSTFKPNFDMDNLMEQVLRILPDAQFEEDNDGQIVIYTNLSEKKDGTVERLSDRIP